MSARARFFFIGTAVILVAAACVMVFVVPELGGARRLEAVALRPEQMEGYALVEEGMTNWQAGSAGHQTFTRAAYQIWENASAGTGFRVTWALFDSQEAAMAAGRTGGMWTEIALQPGTYSGQPLGDASWRFEEATFMGSGWISFACGRMVGSVQMPAGTAADRVFRRDLAEAVARTLLQNMGGGE